MTRNDNEKLRRAYTAWLKPLRPERAVAVTVTFKPTASGASISTKAGQDAIRHFSNQMNQKAYGRKFKRKEVRLDFIPVMEGGPGFSSKHLHYHIQMGVPEGWSIEGWMRCAAEQLSRIRCVGSAQCKVRPVTDEGWQSYILKAKDKANFADSIDLESFWVNT